MQRYFAKSIENNKITLYDSDIHHIKKVMRMQKDDYIEVVYNEKIYTCKLDNDFSCIIEKVSNEKSGLSKELIVAVGLVKEQKMDLILQKLTELGVSKIIPVNMERSIVKLDSKKEEKKLERWNMICKEASEQSKRTSITIVNDIINLKDLIDIKVDKKLVCSTTENFNMIHEELDDKNYESVLVVIGPEGGISPKEEIYLEQNGFIRISFGQLILRVETACIYMASIFNYIVNKK